MKNKVFLRLKNVNKIYPNGVHAVFDFNLDVNQKEFIVFVGPSGCGKSTTLRMIAGLEEITRGDFYLDQRLANNLSPKERDVAMVFQSYALYPHMNVYNNLAFGLKMRKVKETIVDEHGNPVLRLDDKMINRAKRDLKNLNKDIDKVHHSFDRASQIMDKEKKESTLEQLNALDEALKLEKAKKEEELAFYQTTEVPQYYYRRYKKSEIMEKVQRAVQILDIEDYLFSRPRELSGGQRQRVALGRSIVRNAKLFLMDEPLSNLDAKLRISMRSEIVALHRSLGATTIYVTHDQIEAMTMADRIVVMKDGYIQQVGTPLEIYHQPLNVFVATFMGSPAMNIISSNYQKGMITVNGTGLKLTDKMIETIKLFIDKKIGELNDKYHQTQAYLDSLITEREQLSKSFKHKSLEQRINAKQGLLKEILTQKEAYDKASKEDTQELLIGVRPENLVISQQQSQDSIMAEVTFVELLGKEYYVHLLVNNTRVIASVSPKEQFNIGDRVGLELKYSSVSIFDPISELRIV